MFFLEFELEAPMYEDDTLTTRALGILLYVHYLLAVRVFFSVEALSFLARSQGDEKIGFLRVQIAEFCF